MKNMKNKITMLSLAIAMLFIASAYAQPKINPAKTELQKKIKELNQKIKTATTDKARIQRQRDMLIRQLKELKSITSTAQTPPIIETKG